MIAIRKILMSEEQRKVSDDNIATAEILLDAITELVKVTPSSWNWTTRDSYSGYDDKCISCKHNGVVVKATINNSYPDHNYININMYALFELMEEYSEVFRSSEYKEKFENAFSGYMATELKFSDSEVTIARYKKMVEKFLDNVSQIKKEDECNSSKSDARKIAQALKVMVEAISEEKIMEPSNVSVKSI